MLSSFHGQTAKGNATAHNKREQPPKYLLVHDNAKNEFKQYIENRKEVLEEAKKIVKNKTGRSMQESAVKAFWQEAVINIKEDTKLEDIEKLFKNLNEHFKGGFELSEIAIHKDEGAFIETQLNAKDIKRDSKTGEWFLLKTGENISDQVKAYMPNKDIFYNKQNKKWYIDKDLKTEAPKNLQKYFNLHAHAIYNKFNYDTGKTVRMKKSDLQKIQDITAETLGMIRTNPNQNRKRRTAQQQKDFYKKIDDVRKEERAKQKDLKAEIAELRKQLQEQHATRKEYAQLEQLNKELKEKIKAKDLTLAELQQTIEEQKEQLKKQLKSKEQSEVNLDEIVKAKDKEIAELKTENIKLKQENKAMEKALNWLGKTKEWALKGYNKLLDIFSLQQVQEQQPSQEPPKELSDIEKILYGDRTEEDTEKASNIRKYR